MFPDTFFLNHRDNLALPVDKTDILLITCVFCNVGCLSISFFFLLLLVLARYSQYICSFPHFLGAYPQGINIILFRGNIFLIKWAIL